MNISQAIRLLQEAKHRHHPDNANLSPMRLIGIVFEGQPGIVQTMRGREQLAKQVNDAKRAAGARGDCDFFRDVWPEALQAMLTARKFTQRAAVLLPGGEASRDQHCVVVGQGVDTYIIQPGAQALTLHDGRRLRKGDSAAVPQHLVVVQP